MAGKKGTDASPVLDFESLQQVFNTMIDGVILIDTRGIIRAVNPATCRLFSYPASDLTGRNVSLLMPSPHRENHDGYIGAYMRTGVKKIIGIGREVEGKRKDGTVFPFRLSISECLIEGEKHFCGIIHDITEIKEAQYELELVNKQLEKIVNERTNDLTATVNKLLESNSKLKEEITRRLQTESELEKALVKEKELGVLKSRFVTMASHEFRTPLSTILSSANIISRYTAGEDQSKRERHTDKIQSAVKNMTNILEDILSLGKLEEGKIVNEPEPIELLSFTEGVISMLDAILKEGQEIEVVSDSDRVEVRWAENLTENILNNLLSNAVKYSGENSTVTTEIIEEDSDVVIRITDRGIGIPKDQQKHLFDRFFRATNATNIKGTGLGLHIVNEYLKLMQGTIEFTSKEGEGSVFSIRIPASYTV